jgi:hypothetical protein
MDWTLAIGVDIHKEVHVAVANRPARRPTRQPGVPDHPGGLPRPVFLGARARGARLRDRGHGQLRRGARSLPRASRCGGLRVRAPAPARSAGAGRTI